MQRLIASLGWAAWLAFSSSGVAQFSSGNLAVYRIGTGSGALGSAATATFIDQYNTSATGQIPINTVAIDATGANRLTNSGSATSEGALVRSTNGLFLSFGGYDADAGTTGIAATTAAADPRVVGFVNSAGAYTRYGNFGSNFSGGNIRGAIYDPSVVGGRAWAVGSNTGVVANVNGTVNVVSTSSTNNRVINIFSDQLYFSSGAGTRGIWAVGSGTPTGTGNTSVNIIATGAASSPYGFQANTTGDVVYIADDSNNASGGIQKWTWNGSSWVQSYVLGTGFTNIGARGLTVDWGNPSAPVIYATTGEASANHLIKITDTGAASTATTLATAASNTAFRGVDQTLLPAVWTSSAATANWVNPNTNGAVQNFGNQYANWSIGLADGINLVFQNTNAAAVAATNNSTLTSVSSIVFTGAGFGSQNTAYTLSGNDLNLTGTPATGLGVVNNSSVTQTINLNLAFTTPQTFNAASGNLVFGGNVNTGFFGLAISGNSATTINGVLSGGGSINKTGAGTLVLSNNNSGYFGDIGVNQGTLLVSGANPTGSANINVNNGGVLRGNATVANVVVNSGGTVAPGASPGTLNSSLATWKGGGIYQFEITNATGAAGTDWDLWNVTANNGLTISATSGNPFVISIPDPQTVLNFDPSQNYSWQFASYVGAIGGVGFDPNAFNVLFGSPFSGGSFTVSNSSGALLLNFSPGAVPEPTSIALVGLAAAAAMVLRRRRAQ